MPSIYAGNVAGTVYAAGNTTQATSAGVSLGSLQFAGAGVASVGVSGGTVLISVPSGGGAGDGGNVLAAGGSTAASTGTIGFVNSNGVSFGLNGTAITATVKTDYLTTAQPVGAYLTTAALSDHTHSQYQSTGAYLTTAAQVSHSHGGVSLALTNLTGTTASASNGLTLSLSAAAGGAGGGATVNGSTGNVSIVAGANITLNTAGSTISIVGPSPGGGAAPGVRWACPQWAGADFVLLSNITALTQRPLFFPFECGGNLTAGELHWHMSRSTSGSNNFTMHVGVYSQVNQTQASLFASTSNYYSNTATVSISGVRQFEFQMGAGLSTLSQGQWILGLIFSATATASMNYSLMGASTLNPGVGRIDVGADNYATHTSHGEMPFWGRFSTTSGGLPNTIAQSQLIAGLSGASLPLPMNFTLASHN